MKKFITGLLILTVCFFTSCHEDREEYFGSDNIISEDRVVSDFQNIDNNDIINTNVTFGQSQSVQVIANDNIIDNVKTKVTGNTLSLELIDGNYKNVSIEVDIVIPELAKINNSGTGNININGFEALDDLTIESVGTGNINASGATDNLKVVLTGTGNFNGFDFITKSSNVNLTGTGNTEIFCSDELNGSITGTGNIYYKGKPSINVSVTGTGNIINAN